MLDYDFHIHSHYSDGDNSLKEIVNECISKNVTHMAFTDHMDDLGNFMHYNFASNTKKNLEDYLFNISKLQHKYQDKIRIFTGAEISTDIRTNKSIFKDKEDKIIENLDYFSIFLIEGWYISDPINTAINLQKFLNDINSKIPVVIAHPEYDSISYKDVIKLIDYNIGLELNENKFYNSTGQNFLSILRNLDDAHLKALKITIGSDAHNINLVGEVYNVKEFVIKNDLVENIVLPIESIREFSYK